jgi:glycosyltransferase involved in cell wall biosynthesis
MTGPLRDVSLRVLMTADAVGGVWNYALNLARATEHRGIAYTIATMGPAPTPDQRAQAAALPNVRLEVSDYKLEWMPEPWADVDRAGRWLLDLERRERPDAVHLNGFSHGILPFRAPKLIVGHSCCLSWWRSVKGEDPPASWSEYRRRVRRGIHAADAFAAPSAAMAAELERLYTPRGPILVIPNGAPASAFRAAEKDPVVLAAGRLWDEAKNISALARIVPRVPWTVLVAGARGGPVGGPLDSTGLVRLGHLSARDMTHALARAAICVHPARYEPFGLLPLEAALAGCALVLGDIPTLREIWADAALYADPRDPDQLLAQINRLIADPDLRTTLAAAARCRARRYSLGRFGGAYADLYEDLAAMPAPAIAKPAPAPLPAHSGA